MKDLRLLNPIYGITTVNKTDLFTDTKYRMDKERYSKLFKGDKSVLTNFYLDASVMLCFLVSSAGGPAGKRPVVWTESKLAFLVGGYPSLGTDKLI